MNLWRHRDFRLLWTGYSVSKLGSAVSSVVVPLIAVETLNAEPFVVGLLAAAAWLPWLLVSLPAGAWIDRLRRRPVMIATDLVCFGLFASVPVAVWFGGLTAAHLLVVALLGGVGSVLFTTAGQVYLMSIVHKDDLSGGTAKLQGSQQVAMIAGPGLAGVIAQFLGAAMGMFVDAISFLVSALCLMFIRFREPPPSAKRRATTLRQEIGEGMRFVFRDRYMRVIVAGMAVDNFALNAVQVLLPVYLIREVGAPAGAVGALLAATGVGGVIGTLVAGRVSSLFGPGRAIALSFICTAPFSLLLLLADAKAGYVFFALGLLVPAAGTLSGAITATVFVQAYCPRAMLGRALTSSRFVYFGLIPLGALVGGSLGSFLGTTTALWMMIAVWSVGKLIWLIGPLRKCEQLPEERTTEIRV